uniref:Uncharacterized protein n=1 Tax=Oryza nivara TaxID=4536 RepID=A0A0E0HSD9_ORYNI
MSSSVSSVRLENASGISPVMFILDIQSLANAGGTGAGANPLSASVRRSRAVRLAISAAGAPSRALLARSRNRRRAHRDSAAAGNAPVSWLLERSSRVRLARSHTAVGTVPVRFMSCRDSSVTTPAPPPPPVVALEQVTPSQLQWSAAAAEAGSHDARCRGFPHPFLMATSVSRSPAAAAHPAARRRTPATRAGRRGR